MESFDPYRIWLGITPQEQPPNLYRLLGLRLFEDNVEAIESAVDQRLAYLRTKTTGPHGAEAERLIRQITQARLVLMDDKRRAEYDLQLRAEAAPTAPGTPGTTPLEDDGTFRLDEQPQTESLPSMPAPLPSGQPSSPRRVRSGPRKRSPRRNRDLWIGVWSAALALLVLAAVAVWLSLPGRQPAEDSQQTAHSAAGATGAPASPPSAPEGEKAEEADSEENREEPPAGNPPGQPSERESSDEPPADGVNGEADAPSPPPGPREEPPPAPPRQTPPEPEDPDELPWLERVRQATVVVRTDQARGSGFLIEGQPIAVTNHHVIEQARVIFLQLANSETVSVRRCQLFPEADLAFLEVSATELPEGLPLREGEVSPGADVWAYGSPLGFSNTLTRGIVSAYRSSAELQNVVRSLGDRTRYPLLSGDTKWVQTDAPLGQGNSGGPLVDRQGRVVGVNTLEFADAQNLNLAVSAEEVRTRLDRLALTPFVPESEPEAPLAGNEEPEFDIPAYWGLPSLQFARVHLPGGDVLAPGRLFPPGDWVMELIAGKLVLEEFFERFTSGKDVQRFAIQARDVKPVYVKEDRTGRWLGAIQFDSGQFEGLVVLFYEWQVPMLISQYSSGKRHGSYMILDEDGYPLVYREYSHGMLDGVEAFFKDRMPVHLRTYSTNIPTGNYLVTWENNTPEVETIADIADPERKAELRELDASCRSVLASVESLEMQYKRELISWYRDVDQKMRQAHQAAASVAARRRIIGRIHERMAAQVEGHNSVRRRAGLPGISLP